MIKLSYCTFGLTELTLGAAIDAVHEAGYSGVELSFHRDQFNPFNLTPSTLEGLRQKFSGIALKPACVATASHFFTPSRPHEPSLMCPDLAGRKRRIDLVRRGIEVARALDIPLVTFGSGFIRDEHVSDPTVDPRALLVDSIQRCLAELQPDDDITLLLEPEPGMYIETLDQALDLVGEIDSPRFRLHLDLCHIYCSELDAEAALKKATPYARYLHVSDAERGYNLKMVKAPVQRAIDLDLASYLVYFPASADFLLLDREHPMFFSDERGTTRAPDRAQEVAQKAGIEGRIECVDYRGLFSGTSELDDEVFTYLISVPGVSFDVLDRARPILLHVRSALGVDGRRLVERRIANTLTGIVHFHEIPGRGILDLESSFRILKENGFDGYASVELYHHVSQWQRALKESHNHLAQFV